MKIRQVLEGEDIKDQKLNNKNKTHTGIIPQNRGFHDGLHPIPNNTLLFRAEVMSLIMIMINPETISSGINILINCNLISNNMDISLDPSFLQTKSVFNQKLEKLSLLIYCYPSRNTNVVL